MEQPSLSRWKISTLRSPTLNNAASLSISRRLKHRFAGWHSFAIQMGTNSWSTNEKRNDEILMMNDARNSNAQITKTQAEQSTVIRISSFIRRSTFDIRHSDHVHSRR